jgi:endonuclease YncB( thermonuclease family)
MRRGLAAAVWVLGACVLSVRATASEENKFEGRVVSVAAGHAMTVLADGGPARVRLFDAQSPRSDQPFSADAKKLTASEVFDRTVTVEVKKRDANGVLFAKIRLPGGRSLSELLVKEGLAWWNRTAAPDDRRLERLERKAQKARRGLWSNPNPASPWASPSKTVPGTRPPR